MEEQVQNNEIEIDLQRLFTALLKRVWLIGLVAIICAVATFLGTFFFVTPQYQSAVMIYVNNSDMSLGDASFSISSSDLSASKTLVKSYIVILKSRTTLAEVIDYAGVNRTYGQMKNMISAAAVDSTEIFQVVVTSPDPREAETIANAVAHVLPKRIAGIIDGTSAKVVDYAICPTTPSSPNYMKNAAMGLLIGLVAMCAIVVIRELLDHTVRTEEDITRTCSQPILASVPDMEQQDKSKAYYYNRKKQLPETAAETVVIGDDIPFAAAEAYKLLRTKLQFSFADEQDCHVIGVSSALTGEGKSVSSVNLALTMAQLDKRVLLLECDLRRPSLFIKLPVEKMPGLSNYLTRQVKLEEIVQTVEQKNGRAIHVITSGRVPPNPIELLSSDRMAKLLGELRSSYDYIILDLPPVTEVSDALVAAEMADGMLLVVRQNYCDRLALEATVRQFRFVEARLLGVMVNCRTESGISGYTAKYPYKYYNRYKEYEKYRKYRRAAESQTAADQENAQ